MHVSMVLSVVDDSMLFFQQMALILLAWFPPILVVVAEAEQHDLAGLKERAVQDSLLMFGM